jgi:predicted transcriptional regulator
LKNLFLHFLNEVDKFGQVIVLLKSGPQKKYENENDALEFISSRAIYTLKKLKDQNLVFLFFFYKKSYLFYFSLKKRYLILILV